MITREEFDEMIDKDELYVNLEEIKALLGILIKTNVIELDMNQVHIELIKAFNMIGIIQGNLCRKEGDK